MKERPGVFLKNQAPWSKQNPLPAALKQRHAKTRFQIPHLLGNTRLRNSQPISRSTEAACLRNGEKIAEVADVQRLRHGERILCGRLAECNELDAKSRSELIAGQDAASIGKTYWAISKTF